VHAFVNDVERPVGTHLYGRRMYETLKVWDTMHDAADPSPAVRDFTDIWQAADKIVYSTTLDAVTTGRTRLQREFEPAAVREFVDGADRDVSVGGPGLAGTALRAGIVDECQLFLNPVVIGAGTRALPDDVRIDLTLLDLHRFDNGVVYVRYAVVR
jgi:dihydrofolate reductase